MGEGKKQEKEENQEKIGGKDNTTTPYKEEAWDDRRRIDQTMLVPNRGGCWHDSYYPGPEGKGKVGAPPCRY